MDPTSPLVEDPPVGLLERDAAIAALRADLAGAQAERGAVRLISGPAGIGKTALLDVVRGAAEKHDALVLGARASELDRGFGFGVVHQLLEPVLRTADDKRRRRLFAGAAGRAQPLFSTTGTVADDPGYGVLSGLYWLIVNLADERPVVLCVDDLHWADVASLRMLEFLGRRIDDLPALIVGTVRVDEPGAPTELLAALQTCPTAQTITPDTLSASAVETMLHAVLGAPPDDAFREAALGATGGNPLLLSILARDAAGRGLRGDASEAEQLPALAARGVAPAITRRLGTLGPDATVVARAAAVVGERARLEELVALAALDPTQVQQALGVLGDAQILAPGGWAYVHPLVRAAVATAIPRAEHSRLHRSAARRLRERGAKPAEVALHWLAADPAGHPDAVADLRAAARDAAVEGATDTAVDLLRRALEEGVTDADRPGVLLELAEHELRSLQPEGVPRVREALDADLAPADEVRAHAALGTVLLLTDPVAAVAEIEIARAQATDPRLRLQLEASELEALVLIDALATPRAARFDAIRHASDPSVVELAQLASEEALVGRPITEITALAQRAVADGALLRDVGPGGSTWNLLTHALRFAEQPEACRRLLLAGERVVRERGLLAAGAFVDQSWGYWHRDFGSVARGLAHAQAGYDAIVEGGLPMSQAALAGIMAENLVLLDRAAEADELMDRPFGAAEGTFVEVFALTARGLTRTHTGRHDEAEADLRRVVSLLDARGWHAPFAAKGRLRLAELLVARGDRAEALALIDRDVAVAEAAGTSGALGTALRVRALAQDGGERLGTLRRAVDALAASPLSLEHGRALLELGTTLRHHDQHPAARNALRQALDAASRTESAWLDWLVRKELQASGARPRRERVSGVESLTPRERRIAELAAEGRSNAEIAETLWVTRKTVEYHLGNVFTKLDIRSRKLLPRRLGVDARP